jgi:hypothetical protein
MTFSLKNTNNSSTFRSSKHLTLIMARANLIGLLQVAALSQADLVGLGFPKPKKTFLVVAGRSRDPFWRRGPRRNLSEPKRQPIIMFTPARDFLLETPWRIIIPNPNVNSHSL